MNNLVMASFVTLGISITSAGVLSRFRSLIRDMSIVTHIDQCMRALMLAFAIYHIGHELMELFTLRVLVLFSIGFLLIQASLMQVGQLFPDHAYIHEKYPWLIYTLLFPHFITEGFMIAPQAGKHSINLVIAGFLVHKVFEVAMLTLSANHQIHCRTQRRILQTIFVSLTPLAILLYVPFQSYMKVNSTLMGYTEFLNFIVFIQLSTFCQFCKHNPCEPRPWFQSNRTFIAAFSIISVLVYFYPELLISGCA